MKRLFYGCLVLALGFLACQPRFMWWKQQPDSYQAIVRKWTQTGEVYQGLKTILVVSATYPHPDVHRAHVRQYGLNHHLSEQEQKELLSQKETEAKSQLEFIMTTFSDEEEWCPLDDGDSIWTIYLINDKGVRVKPQKIECLKEVPVYIKTYYPLFSPWKKVYRVVFPLKIQNTPLIDEQTRHFDIDFISAVGQIKLHWDLKGESP